MLDTQDPNAPAVAWVGVSKSYPRGHQALRDVTLEVRRGSILALLGTSGSGKTTLLKMVNRLIEPTSGSVRVRGRPTASWGVITLRRSLGYVIQEGGLMPHLTVGENVGLPLKVQGQPRERRAESARAALEMVSLDPARFEDLFPGQLSGGQRQRVGVARAIAADADIILMDEPFGALDPITRRQLQDEFRQLQRRLRTTVVLVTHDLREACRLGDTLALLHDGRLLQSGPAIDFIQDPADDYVREFFREAGAVEIEREAGA